jgi:hypothetical protein
LMECNIEKDSLCDYLIDTIDLAWVWKRTNKGKVQPR